MRERIRPATGEDLPEIVALYARVYPHARGPSLQGRAAYMNQILMQHPWRTDSLPSLVYEDESRRIVGFMGVMPRRMLFRGRPIRMAVTHHFMVDPACRTTLAGLSLMKVFLSGGQELSMCQPGGDLVRKMWEALGGTTALLQSLHWTRTLRPVGYLVSQLRERGMPAFIAHALTPGSWLLDAIATRTPESPFRLAARDTLREEPPLEVLLDAIEEYSQGYSLRPVYDARELRWLLVILAEKKTLGRLQTRIVRAAGGERLGYYLYYAREGRVNQVLQVAARTGSFLEVLDELANDAWASGALALSGALDPRYVREISHGASYIRWHGGHWLIHTHDPELQRVIYGGDVFITRLEGEWWIPFYDATDDGGRRT